MAKITHYMAHDPIGNVESYLTEFDSELIARAAAAGIIFIAVYDDGTREVVDAGEVEEPQQERQAYEIVTTSYVDRRTAATVACFEALSAIVDPQPAAADETGEEAEAFDPVEAFRAALAALKALEAAE